MAPRSFWKGYLRLSLVTCRVSLVPAARAGGKVRFNTISRSTGNRVESRYLDQDTGKVVSDEDEARGYRLPDGRMIILEDEELEAVALESTRAIDVEQFVPAGDIAWIWLDKAYYLLPEDKVSEEAYCVIRDAMAATEKVGISRLVLYRRERAVMLEPRGKGIIVWTLRYGDEVRDAEAYFSGIDASSPDARALRLVARLIEATTRAWRSDMVEDPVQERLKALIEAKKGKRRKPPARKAKAGEPAETPDNVVSIMDALRRSVETEKRGGKSS